MTLLEKLIVASILILLLSMPAAKIFSAKMESDTYNKLTGAHTTWRDALWVELRVQDKPK